MSVRTSAFSTEHMALITASATSLRTAAVLHALGSHAIWTKGMSGRARGESARKDLVSSYVFL